MGRMARFIDLLCFLVSKEEERGSSAKSSDLWSHQLPQDILNLILQRLTAGDHIRLSAVCTNLRTAIARAEVSPLLDFPLVFHSAASGGLLFSRVAMDKIYPINPFHTRGSRIVGVVEGHWLIMWSYGVQTNHFFLDLMTGEKIMLPLQSTLSTSNFCNPRFFRKIVASSQPTNPDCLVAGVIRISLSGFCLAFCRVTDTKWTLLDQDDTIKDLPFVDIIFCDGKLYAAPRDLTRFLVVVFDLRCDNLVYKAHKLVIGAPRPISSRPAIRKEENEYHLRIQTFLLAADSVSRELLLIFIDNEKISTKEPILDDSPFSHIKYSEKKGFRLFKMDMDRRLWIEITNIGNRLLFVACSGSFFVSVESLGEAIPGNCIYYAFDSPPDPDVGRFCLTDKTIQRYRTKSSASAVNVNCGWFMPAM